MPVKGWKTVTIPVELYEKIEKFMIDYNYKHGARVYRSVAHVVELAVSNFIKKESEKIEPNESKNEHA